MKYQTSNLGVNAVLCLSLQETSEHFLVLFSFHLLILSLDQQDFIYKVFFVRITLRQLEISNSGFEKRNFRQVILYNYMENQVLCITYDTGQKYIFLVQQ